jgi:16S rRNA (guanine966-N2)-methyltransferase
VRIIAGSCRGRRLEAPQGKGTRPTTDRVRESLMSALISLRGDMEDAEVLDAFAGSGALGLEALSRGAAQCVFVESDRKASALIERNIQTCGFNPGEARVIKRDVFKAAPVLAGSVANPFDVVFLDPPYVFAAQDVFALLESLVSAGALSPEVLVMYEHDAKDDEEVSEVAAGCGFVCASRRHFGDTSVDFYERTYEEVDAEEDTTAAEASEVRA